MITYRVTYMGSIKKPTRLSTLSFEFSEEMTIRQLVLYLLDKGETIGSRADYPSDPLENLLIIVNGSAIPAKDGSSTTLHDNDEVAILVPLFGG